MQIVSNKHCTVVDLGSATIKIGQSGDLTPNNVLYSFYDESKNSQKINEQNIYNSQVQNIKPIIKHGLIENNEKLIELIKSSQQDMTNLIFAHSYYTPKEQLIKLAQILFEKENVKALAFMQSPICNVFSQGLQSGLSIDMGYGSTQICPVIEGQCLNNSSRVCSVNTELIQNELIKRLNQQYQLNLPQTFTVQNYQLIDSIFQSFNFQRSYTLPDNTEIKCQELLGNILDSYFEKQDWIDQPAYATLQFNAFTSLLKLPQQLKGTLLNQIILSGGISNVKYINQQFQAEMNTLFTINHLNKRIKVVQEDICRNEFNTFFGASVVGSCGLEGYIMTTKEEFQERGQLK